MVIREFKQQFKIATANRYLRFALIAVMLIPLFYGALYLKAFWDPYAKIDQVPVAIVNHDKGITSNGSTINVGNELVNNLKTDNHLKWEFVSEQDANNGMQNKHYYASLTIPENFSSDTYSVDSDKPTKSTLIYKSREATNFLATMITDKVTAEVADSLSHKIINKYFDNIFISLKSTASDLTKAKDASIQLSDGLSSASSGANTLYSGLSSASSGSKQLSDGISTLNVNQNKLTTGLSTAVSGAAQLKTGAESVSGGIVQGQGALSAYIASNPGSESNPYLQGLSTALSASKAGQSQVIAGLSNMKSSLITAETGSSELTSGSAKLLTGANELNSGLSQLSTGANSLSQGLQTAKDGMIQLKDKLSDGADKAVASTEDKKVAAETAVMSKPVSLQDNSYDIVPNYGSGFAPYFISLALWVGGLLSFFVIDFSSKPKTKVIAMMKYIILALLGTAQAVLLDLVLVNSLGLKVANPIEFYSFTILASLTFMAILQILIQHLDNIGRYIGIVLLILQLASAAGTFPKETLPVFFQIINPLLPMTYTVAGLKDIIFTNELTNLWTPIAYLSITLVICIILNFIITKNQTPKIFRKTV